MLNRPHKADASGVGPGEHSSGSGRRMRGGRRAAAVPEQHMLAARSIADLHASSDNQNRADVSIPAAAVSPQTLHCAAAVLPQPAAPAHEQGQQG